MERARILTNIFFPLIQFLPFFLYAETHYRFRYFFSFIRKNEPEILADAPHRIEPGQNLPILILVKDAHKYPVKFNKITAVLSNEKGVFIEKELLQSPVELSNELFWKVYEIPLEDVNGIISCDIIFEIIKGGKKLIYRNDNHRTSTRLPLNIFVSTSPLPGFKNLCFGECHSHSIYTSDQVEFGSPLEASVKLSRALGLSFFCSTDHSYDMDDSINNYLVNDDKLPKWQAFQKAIDLQNSQNNNFTVIRGEEVTCRNSKDQNVHLLLLGNNVFFFGSGDGAEKWLKTRSENSISDILAAINSSVLSFAAHPRENVSLLQRILLRRGEWSYVDLNHPALTGTQFINGYISNGFIEGYSQWIEALLKGKELFIIAGDDAHGNFNRFRQIGIPFLKIRENNHQLFGKMRTGVFTEKLSEQNILQSIKSGRTIATDGPALNLWIDDKSKNISSIGGKFRGSRFNILLEVKSSIEYGTIDYIKIFMGKIGGSESVVLNETPSNQYCSNKDFVLKINKTSYIRAETWTSATNSIDKKAHFCLSNPIWLSTE